MPSRSNKIQLKKHMQLLEAVLAFPGLDTGHCQYETFRKVTLGELNYV